MNDIRKVKLLLSCGASSDNYVSALTHLGADVHAEYLPMVNTDYDGLILCGGTDVEPRHYGEKINGSVNIDLERDAAELALLKAYTEAGKPIMGICRGHQIINIFFGGSLYQDIPESALHKRQNGIDNVHTVTASPDSILARLYGETFQTNSSHHQAVKELGKGLCATALWEDKYIEAIEHTSLPIIGVQWHPERMCFDRSREDTVSGADILRYFIDLCQKHREK